MSGLCVDPCSGGGSPERAEFFLIHVRASRFSEGSVPMCPLHTDVSRQHSFKCPQSATPLDALEGCTQDQNAIPWAPWRSVGMEAASLFGHLQQNGFLQSYCHACHCQFSHSPLPCPFPPLSGGMSMAMGPHSC